MANGREERPSQKRAILEHLKRFGSIEPLMALREYGCLCLAERIRDLREDGYKIVTEKMTVIGQISGKPVQIANYFLK